MNDHLQYKLSTPNGERIIFYRPDTTDALILQQIFVQQDYNLQNPRLPQAGELLAFYLSVLSNHGQPLIVDCGANIGASAVYFATVFPNSVVVAIEPDDANYDLLVRNTNGLRVESQLAAIGSYQGEVHVYNQGYGECGFRTAAEGNGQLVKQLAMRNLVTANMAKGRTPFIAKIDIEGGESELFSHGTEWIDFFPLIILELHDWLMPGSANSQNFLQSIASRGRDFVYINENIFSFRNF